MWPRIQTFLLVVIITAFIWVLAERQITQTQDMEVVIELPLVQKDAWYEFTQDGKPAAETRRTVRLEVQAPIHALQAAKNHGLFAIEMKPLEELPERGSQDFTIDVVKQILQGQLPFEGGVLNVREAKPSYLNLRVTRRVAKTLPVKVRDAVDNHDLSVETVKPALVEVMVVEASPQTLEATVRLTVEQQRLALRQPIKAMAEVRYQTRLAAEQQVEVKLAEAGSTQTVVEIAQPRLGLLMPLSMQCQYRMVIEAGNEPALEPIRIRGSATAIAEYRQARYHLMLEIDEKDLTLGTAAISRPLQYFLPETARQEMTLVNPPQRVIRFHLEPLEGPAKTD